MVSLPSAYEFVTSLIPKKIIKRLLDAFQGTWLLLA